MSRRAGEAAFFPGSVLRVDLQTQTLQLWHFSEKSVSGERPALGAGRVLIGFVLAGEGKRHAQTKIHFVAGEGFPLSVWHGWTWHLALLTVRSAGEVSLLWAVVTTQESEGSISQSNFKKVTSY